MRARIAAGVLPLLSVIMLSLPVTTAYASGLQAGHFAPDSPDFSTSSASSSGNGIAFSVSRVGTVSYGDLSPYVVCSSVLGGDGVDVPVTGPWDGATVGYNYSGDACKDAVGSPIATGFRIKGQAVQRTQGTCTGNTIQCYWSDEELAVGGSALNDIWKVGGFIKDDSNNPEPITGVKTYNDATPSSSDTYYANDAGEMSFLYNDNPNLRSVCLTGQASGNKACWYADGWGEKPTVYGYLFDGEGGGGAPPDPTDPSDSDCGLSLNPLTYIKCALKWAFIPPNGTMTAWTELRSTAASKPPLSLVIGGVQYIQGFSGVQDNNPDCNDSNNAGDEPDAGGCKYTIKVQGTDNVALDFLTPMSDFMQQEGQFSDFYWGPRLYKLMEVSVWFPVILWTWSRIGMSFGSKESE